MKLSLHVKTGKRTTKVTKTGDTAYTVEVTARPEQGRANAAVLRALAKHLNLAPSRLRIVSGLTSQSKIVEFD